MGLYDRKTWFGSWVGCLHRLQGAASEEATEQASVDWVVLDAGCG